MSFFLYFCSLKLYPLLDTLVSYNILQYSTAQQSNNITANSNPEANPEAKSQSVKTEQDKSINIHLEGSDRDGDTTLIFSIESYPLHGTLSGIREDEDIPKVVKSDQVYKPDSGFTGHDEFEFFVDDTSEMRSKNAIITITISPSTLNNNAPTAEDQVVETPENTQVKVVLRGHDVDAGDTLNFQKQSDPKHGSLVNLDLDKGTVTYAPKEYFVGADSFTFLTVDNHQKHSKIAKVSLKIIPINLPPKADAGEDSYITTGEEVTLDGSGSKDVDGTIKSYFWAQVDDGPHVRLENRKEVKARTR